MAFVSKMCVAVVASMAAVSVAQEAEVTPVSKVIDLLASLKADVEAEGKSEAEAYDKFSCWCRDATKSKSDSIISGRDNIQELSAEIQEKTAQKEESEAELKDRQAKAEQMAAELKDTEARFEKARAEYDAEAADLSKAIRGLENAIQAMEGSKPTSLLAIRSTIADSLALASAMDLVSESKRKAVSAFLQTGVDPSDPTYAYHSQGIIDTLNQLLKEFRAEKATLDEEWGKSKSTFESTISSLKNKISENATAMDNLVSLISDLKGKIAVARQSLVTADGMLKDDQLYMKDMTERCELRAKDWDQRSQLRADELEALTEALKILTSKATTQANEVSKRALLQKAEHNATLASVSPHAPIAFLQEAAHSTLRSGLRGAAAAQARQEEVVKILGKEGRRLKSTALSALAMHVAADPFGKVKTLIQQLVERLLKEATDEATKKGFCDEEVGKAEKDRDFRLQDTNKLDVELKALNLKAEELAEEARILGDAVSGLRDDLSMATDERGEEKDENTKTMKLSKEGYLAVKQAIAILKTFYARAGRAKVFMQFSPIDEAAGSDAGFEGAYKGKQERSKGIIGMLEVIISDFDRTNRKTEEAEANSHAEFTEFDRTARSDISGKETKKALDEEDLKTTVDKIATKMDDLKTQQNLLDAALLRLEELKPMCIDTGMSYEDRVQKREEEIAALKVALCILDGEGVEPDCRQQQ